MDRDCSLCRLWSGDYTSSRRSQRSTKGRSVDSLHPACRCALVSCGAFAQAPMFPCPRWPRGYSRRSASPPWDSLRRFYPCRTACGNGNSPYAPYTPAWRGSVPRHSRSSYTGWKIPLCFSRCPCPACRSTRQASPPYPQRGCGQYRRGLCPQWSNGRYAAPRRQLLRRSANGICFPGLSCSHR